METLQARDSEEMLKLQTDYVRSQIAALTEQAQDLGKLTSHLGTRVKKSVTVAPTD